MYRTLKCLWNLQKWSKLESQGKDHFFQEIYTFSKKKFDKWCLILQKIRFKWLIESNIFNIFFQKGRN